MSSKSNTREQEWSSMLDSSRCRAQRRKPASDDRGIGEARERPARGHRLPLAPRPLRALVLFTRRCRSISERRPSAILARRCSSPDGRPDPGDGYLVDRPPGGRPVHVTPYLVDHGPSTPTPCSSRPGAPAVLLRAICVATGARRACSSGLCADPRPKSMSCCWRGPTSASRGPKGAGAPMSENGSWRSGAASSCFPGWTGWFWLPTPARTSTAW